MKTNVIFLDCPEYMDQQGAARCGLPAEVQYRYTVESSRGQLESAKIRCPRGHWFDGRRVPHLEPQRSAGEQQRAHEAGPKAKPPAGRLRVGRGTRRERRHVADRYLSGGCWAAVQIAVSERTHHRVVGQQTYLIAAEEEVHGEPWRGMKYDLAAVWVAVAGIANGAGRP